MSNCYAVIMAGGIGSRFWPKSRTAFPKQFLDILNTGQTLIQTTFTRYNKIVPAERILVVTSEDYKDIVAQQLPDLPEENIVCEPFRKNTAPCIAYAAFKIHKKDPEAIMIAAPADNFITEEETFSETVNTALSFVDTVNSLVTIGIKPRNPNTGYGYIQHDTVAAAPGIYKVKTFTEKPNLELAKAFLKSGDFLWNAGIFVWKTRNILTAFENYLPEIHEAFAAETDKFNTGEEQDIIENVYAQCTSISIDFGVMEKAPNVYVIPASFTWSDLGTWKSAYDNMQKDYFDNAVVGKEVMVYDTHNCIVHVPDKKLVLLQGLEDYIVVDSEDVLLICKKDKEQEIKEYVADVKRNKDEKYL